MLKSQDIRDIVRLTQATTVAELAEILGWSTAKTQKELYLNGGGILTNHSLVGFKAARALIRQTGREARLEDHAVAGHCFGQPGVIEPAMLREENAYLWKQRVLYWLSSAVEQFFRPDRMALESVAVYTDMAVTQLMLAAIVTQETGRELAESGQGPTPFYEWREMLARFKLPSGNNLDAIEEAFLNDLHATRNDIIHVPVPFDLPKESVYIWLFLGLALSSQFNLTPELATPGLYSFLPATPLANAAVRESCIQWLSNLVPTLLNPVLGSVTVRVNDQGQIGFSNDEGQAFFPDMILVDENGLRYSAQVEIPTTVNLVTAQWWAFYNISMVFIPLGYLALARSLAKQTGYPENRLMAYISPAVSSENI